MFELSQSNNELPAGLQIRGIKTDLSQKDEDILAFSLLFSQIHLCLSRLPDKSFQRILNPQTTVRAFLEKAG